MQRYFIEKNQIEDSMIKMTGGDVHHIKHVMRLSLKDQVIVNTYDGEAYLTEIETFDKAFVYLNIIEKLKVEPIHFHLDLGLALTKKDAFELALKKATELGVSGFIPLSTERSIIKINDFEKKRARFFTICKESSEQSERSTVPKIYDLMSLKKLSLQDYDHLFFAYARETKNNLMKTLKTISSDEKSLVLIGPEGGFSKQEVAWLSHNGFKSISLGQSILRAETAAIYVTSIFRFMAGE